MAGRNRASRTSVVFLGCVLAPNANPRKNAALNAVRKQLSPGRSRTWPASSLDGQQKPERSVIGLTIQQWRSLRRNRKCMYCVHAHTVYGPGRKHLLLPGKRKACV